MNLTPHEQIADSSMQEATNVQDDVSPSENLTIEDQQVARLFSPRLAHQEQTSDFTMEVVSPDEPPILAP